MVDIFARLKKNSIQICTILLWTLIGSILRIINITNKPIWIDEIATMIFSLGNSFKEIPLNQIISKEVLLSPFVMDPSKGFRDVVNVILSEDTHPPFYFVLAHLWGNIFNADYDLTSLLGQRLFSTFWGILLIPLISYLSWSTFNSSIAGIFSAALMALSPYGIYLAQEARHYTFSMMLIVISLLCLNIALKKVFSRETLSSKFLFLWMLINSIGISTHYFFGISAVSIILTFTILSLDSLRNIDVKKLKINRNFDKFILRNLLLATLFLTISLAVNILIWLPSISGNREYSDLSTWLSINQSNWVEWVYPPFQVLASWIPMIYLLPVESSNNWLNIAFASIMMAIFILISIFFKKIFLYLERYETTYKNLKIYISFFVISNGIYFLIIYFLGMDITRAPRYAFVYFPAVVSILGLVFDFAWQNPTKTKILGVNGRIFVSCILLLSFVGSLLVTHDLGFRKSYHADTLADVIRKYSQYSSLVVTSHINLTQTGEIMSIAWEFRNEIQSPSFLLLSQSNELSKRILIDLEAFPKPSDIWLINFDQNSSTIFDSCATSDEKYPLINGYRYSHCTLQ